MDGRLDARALQKPVAADVGEQDRSDARIVEPAGEIDRRNGGDIGPAARGDHAVLRIDRDDDAAGVVARRLADQLGILEGRGAAHDTVNAKRKQESDRRAVEDSDAKLDLSFERLPYTFTRHSFYGATRKTPIPIYDIQDDRTNA